MKSAKTAVFENLKFHVYNQVKIQVDHGLREQVLRQVWYPVLMRVALQVRGPIENQIGNQYR